MDEFLASMSEDSNMSVLQPSATFKRLKRGCLGCVISMLLILALLVCLLAFAFSQIFAKPAHSAGTLTRRAILLAAAVPPAHTNSQARGEFLKRQVAVEYTGGEIFLSSSGESLDALVTDDVAELLVEHAAGSSARWKHDFRNDAHTQIVALPAPDVAKLFRRGRNVVTLTLHDLTPFTYWSAPYYLIVDEPIATATRKITPTRVGTATQVVLPAIVASPTAVATRGGDVPTRTPTSNLGVVGEVGTGTGNDSLLIPLVAVGAGGIVFLILVFFLVRARRRPMPLPKLTGWLDVFDTKTRESEAAIDLSNFPHGVVLMLDPLRVEARIGQDKYLAALEPTTEGVVLVRADLERAVGVPELLNDGMRVVLAKRVELEYHNPFAREHDADDLAD